MKISSKAELNPVFRAMHEQAEALLACGKQVLIEVSEFKNKRSSEFNAYYWLSNGWVAECLNEAGCRYGEFNLVYNAELIHEIQKTIFGIKTTTKMKTDEFCDYMHKITSFWIEKTQGNYQPKEVSESYLIRKGYDLEYNLR